MEWMAWTLPTAIFFVAVFLMLTFMVIWDLRSSPVAREGFLPISTDRGDRLYIGLIGSAFINLAWLHRHQPALGGVDRPNLDDSGTSLGMTPG